MKELDYILPAPSMRLSPHRVGSHPQGAATGGRSAGGAAAPSSLLQRCFVPLLVIGSLLFVVSWRSGGTPPSPSWKLVNDDAYLDPSSATKTKKRVSSSHGDDNTASSSVVESPSRSRDAPYGEFCEPRPRGEQQITNWSKKVISYSLFLPDDQKGQDIPEFLLGGLLANLRLAEVFYPEWVVRVYVLNLNETQIDQVLHLDDKRLEVVKCYDNSPLNLGNTARKMYTRFLAVDDPTVEYGMIRDLDSRPNIRELLAVNEWIASGLGFHALRDHAYHIIPIMGCSFGARKGTIAMTEVMKRALSDHPKDVPGCCADDQNFLTSYVWNMVKDNAIDHDMMPGRCHGLGAKVCRKYPIGPRDDEDFYVGQPFKQGNGGNTHYECSVQCKMSNDEWYKAPLESNH